jgi:hypothetical protein
VVVTVPTSQLPAAAPAGRPPDQHPERLPVQVVIAALRRVLVMVSSSRGFVEGVR